MWWISHVRIYQEKGLNFTPLLLIVVKKLPFTMFQVGVPLALTAKKRDLVLSVSA